MATREKTAKARTRRGAAARAPKKPKSKPAGGKRKKAAKASGAVRGSRARQPARAPRASKSARKAPRPARARAKRAVPPPPPPTVLRRATAVSEYWRKLRECGWLDAVPEAEHRALRERLSAALGERPDAAYRTLAVTSLDLECIEGSGPDEVCSYHSVLCELAGASFGRFRPEQITDELDPALQVARISFCLGDTAFHAEVPYRDDWVQPGLFDLVNRALESTGVAERFQSLPADSQIMDLVFVAPAVLERARELGIIPGGPG